MGAALLLRVIYLLILLCSGLFQVDAVARDYETDRQINTGRDITDAKTLSELPSYQLFNPVLQNHSALLDWQAKLRHTGGFDKIQFNAPSHESREAGHKGQTGFEPFEFDALSKESRTAGHGRLRRSVSGLGCDGLCRQSLCPWTEEWDVDRNRIPMFLKYADCVSDQCSYNIQGVGQRTRNRLQEFTYCDKVRTDIMVLENDEEKWLTNWPIACLCTRHPTTSHARNTAATQTRLSAASNDRVQAASQDMYLTPITISFHRNRAHSSDTARGAGLSSDAGGRAFDDADQSENTRVRLDAQPGHHLTRSQRRRLRAQRRRILQRSETFDELMARRMNERRLRRNL